MGTMNEQVERYEELYQQAILAYLEKTDFNISEWLDEDDMQEFLELQKDIH